MAIGTHKKLLAATLAAVMLFGCGGAEERKAKYLERGKAYIAEEDWDKARVEIRNVLQIDPKTAEAHYLLGQVEEKRQEWRRAYGAYSKAVDLDPDNLPARERLAQFYMLQANVHRGRNERTEEANALGQAQNEIDEILERDPSHPGARALKASMLSREGKVEEALALVEDVVREAPDHTTAVGLLASLYERAGRASDAEHVLVEGVKATADPIGLMQHLAQLYARQDRKEDAERVLRELVSARPDQWGYRFQLAQYLASTDQVDKAEAVLRESISADAADANRYLTLAEFLRARKGSDVAVEYLRQSISQQPDMSELYFGLAQIHEQEQRYDEAKRIYENVVSRFGEAPPALQARNRLATHAAMAGEVDDAKRQIDTVLARNPNDNDALMLQGRMAMQARDYETAVNSFRSVLRDQPESVAVLHYLAEAHMRRGEPELAGSNLRRAMEVAPQNIDARVKYARFLTSQKDLSNALEQIDRALVLDPDNAAALAARSEVLAARGDLAAVKADLARLKEVAPENKDTWLRLARVYMAEGDISAALAEVDAVLVKDPGYVPALLLKTDILTKGNDLAALEAAVEALRAAAPENPESYFRKGRLLRAKGDVSGALLEYERAYGLAQDAGKVLMLSEIISTQLAAGQADLALARLQAILREQPEHNVANNLLGLVHMARKDYAAAEASFMQQLRINPLSATVYTQLATARAQQGDSKGAIAAFEQGLGVLEDDISLQMGLASIHERDDRIDLAIDAYEKVLGQQPNNLAAVNNMAALLADHRTDPASLARAKELADKLVQVRQPVIQDTVGWVYYRNGDYARAVQVLEPVVEAAPQVAVFHYHLGMAYAGAGDKAKARTHLNRALELGNFAEEEQAREALAGL